MYKCILPLLCLTTMTNSQRHVPCPGRQGVFYATNSECKTYYQCKNRMLSKASCFPWQRFDIHSLSCRFIDEVDCNPKFAFIWRQVYGSDIYSGFPEDDLPVGGSPVGGSPVGGLPVGGSQVGGSPVGESPVERLPVEELPVGGSPVAGSPVGGSLEGGSPAVGVQQGIGLGGGTSDGEQHFGGVQYWYSMFRESEWIQRPEHISGAMRDLHDGISQIPLGSEVEAPRVMFETEPQGGMLLESSWSGRGYGWISLPWFGIVKLPVGLPGGVVIARHSEMQGKIISSSRIPGGVLHEINKEFKLDPGRGMTPRDNMLSSEIGGVKYNENSIKMPWVSSVIEKVNEEELIVSNKISKTTKSYKTLFVKSIDERESKPLYLEDKLNQLTKETIPEEEVKVPSLDKEMHESNLINSREGIIPEKNKLSADKTKDDISQKYIDLVESLLSKLEKTSRADLVPSRKKRQATGQWYWCGSGRYVFVEFSENADTACLQLGDPEFINREGSSGSTGDWAGHTYLGSTGFKG